MRASAEAAGPELIDAIADFIAAYRACEWPPEAMHEATLMAFPHASGSDFAVGLVRANRRRREVANG
jgi:hypothetical protein